jgi:hypothetical protein
MSQIIYDAGSLLPSQLRDHSLIDFVRQPAETQDDLLTGYRKLYDSHSPIFGMRGSRKITRALKILDLSQHGRMRVSDPSAQLREGLRPIMLQLEEHDGFPSVESPSTAFRVKRHPEGVRRTVAPSVQMIFKAIGHLDKFIISVGSYTFERPVATMVPTVSEASLLTRFHSVVPKGAIDSLAKPSVNLQTVTKKFELESWVSPA